MQNTIFQNNYGAKLCSQSVNWLSNLKINIYQEINLNLLIQGKHVIYGAKLSIMYRIFTHFKGQQNFFLRGKKSKDPLSQRTICNSVVFIITLSSKYSLSLHSVVERNSIKKNYLFSKLLVYEFNYSFTLPLQHNSKTICNFLMYVKWYEIQIFFIVLPCVVFFFKSF